MNWEWLPWRRGRQRAAQRPADAAQAVQLAEHLAARQRLLDVARGNEGPAWNGPTRGVPRYDRPLMTRGQAWRGNGGWW